MSKKIFVCGIGPGSLGKMTVEVRRVLEECQVICGYKLYTDLIKDFFPNKEIINSPMTKEADRCRLAFESASRGKDVAFICSGDSGVYGLAGLILEMQKDFKDVEVELLPGVSAALSGAALLGSPLTNDFCCISLSDRLTPWTLIEKRLSAAVAGDFALVLYNPASKGRPDTLRKACSLLLTLLPEDRPCGYASNIDRAGQKVGILTLKELAVFEADMATTVFIGNSQTRVVGKNLVTRRGYSIEEVL